MATIGSVVLELQANTAQFHQEIGKARESLGQTGKVFTSTEHVAASFAAKGIGAVIPAVQGFEFSLARMIRSTMGATGALGMLGQAGLVVGGVLAVAALVQVTQDYVKMGESVASYTARMKKAAEEEKAFLDQKKQFATMNLGFETQLMQKMTERRGLVLTNERDELGAAWATLEGRRAIIELETRARQRTIVEQVKMGASRDLLERSSNAIAIADRLLAQDQYTQKVNKIFQQQTEDQVKTWQAETRTLLDELKTRLAARQQFEAQLGQGATALGLTDNIAAGFAKVRAIQDAMDRAGRDLAFLERQGLVGQTESIDERHRLMRAAITSLENVQQEFAGTQSVVDAVQKALMRFSLGNFGAEIEKGRTWVDQLISTDQQLVAIQDAVQAKFRELPAVLAAADIAFAASASAAAQFRKELQDVRTDADATTVALQRLAVALSSSQ